MKPFASHTDDLRRTLIRRVNDAAPADALNLGLGQPDLPTPQVVIDAVSTYLKDQHVPYSPTAGLVPLRKAILKHYGREDLSIDHVLVTVGSQEAMSCTLSLLINPGDEVLIPDPGYPAYATLVRLLGGIPKTYSLERTLDWNPSSDDLLMLVSERTKAVVFCSPSNPTGRSLNAHEFKELREALTERGVYWLVDEVYDGLWFDEPVESIARSFNPDEGFVLSGVSKRWSMTGWRIGWILGEARAIQKATAIHQHWVTSAPSPSQVAAIAALGSEGLAAAEDYRQTLDQRRHQMIEGLESLEHFKFVNPNGAFYLFLEGPPHFDAESFVYQLMEKQKVVSIPGTAFGVRSPNTLRLSFAVSEDTLARALVGLREELLKF